MRRWLLLIAGLTACARQSPTPTEVPPEVAYAAVLALDETGALLGASPIQAWASGQPLPVFGKAGARLQVVAWSAAQLERTDQTVPGAKVEAAAVGCAPRLPQALWAASLGEDGTIRSVPPAQLPPLRSEQLTVCDAGAGLALSFDDCTLCAPVVTSASPCRYEFDYQACASGKVRVVALPDHQACFAAPVDSGDWVCPPGEPSGSASAEADCLTPIGSCGAAVYELPGAAPFVAEDLPFRDVPVFEPDLVVRHGRFSPRNLASGYAYDFLVYERELVISTTGTSAVDFCFTRHPPLGELIQMELSSGQVIGTATTPSCLAVLRGDPEGPGFLGVYLDDADRFRFGRFERSGRVVGSAAMEASDGADFRGYTAQVVGLEVGGAFYFAYFGGLRTSDRVQVHSQVSLEPVLDRAFPGLDLTAGRRLNAQAALMAGGSPPRLSWLDLASLTITHQIIAPTMPLSDHSEGVYWVEIQDERIYLAANPPPALYVFDRSGEYRGRHATIGASAQPLRMVNWPSGSGRMLVLSSRPGATQGSFVTYASFFDLLGERFLPGEWRIGEGVVSAVRGDTEGRLYLLLPWAGKLVRLTATP